MSGLQQIAVDYMDSEVKVDALRCVTNVMRDAEVTHLKEENEILKEELVAYKKGICNFDIGNFYIISHETCEMHGWDNVNDCYVVFRYDGNV